MTEADVAVDGKTVCNADITFRVVDFPKGEFLDNMYAVARRILFEMRRREWAQRTERPSGPVPAAQPEPEASLPGR